MSFLQRLVVFNLIPFGTLFAISPDWPIWAIVTIVGFNFLGYIEGTVAEGSR